jgi:hypothetical protein
MSNNNKTRVLQEKLFRDLYHKHVGTPMAVSSESLAHKELRYRQISQIFDGDDRFTIHDVGIRWTLLSRHENGLA